MALATMLLSALHHSAAEGPRASAAISSGRPQVLFSLLRRAETGRSSGASARSPKTTRLEWAKEATAKHDDPHAMPRLRCPSAGSDR